MNLRHPHALRGIVLMIAAVSTFTCLDTTSKYLAQHYPVPAIVWARYVVHMVLMALVLGPRMGRELLRTTNLRLQIIRGVVLAASSLVFLSALSLMPLAEAAAIAFMTPIIIAVFAGPVLGERVEGRTWAALAGGFVGVLLIVRPGGGLFTPAALLPLASAFMMALYQMMTSKLAGRDAPLTTLFYPALIGSALVPIAFASELELPREAWHGALFVLIGVLGAFGHFLLIRAHDYAPSSTLSPFMYAQLITALALGWLVFRQLPDGLSFVGMAAIAASGLVLILGHRRNSVPSTK
ncbi:MAG: DMT family transporter [Burkholderiales bacterium]